MNETKHTPGPWEAGRSDMATIEHGVDSKWIYAGGNYIALASGLGSDGWNQTLANAALIAAAPDLLEVARRYELWEAHLVECSEAWATRSGLPELTQELYAELMEIQALRNAAIAKAKGQTP